MREPVPASEAPLVVCDANVFYSIVLMDLLLSRSVAELLRPRWTAQIHEEWLRNLLADRPELERARIVAHGPDEFPTQLVEQHSTEIQAVIEAMRGAARYADRVAAKTIAAKPPAIRRAPAHFVWGVKLSPGFSIGFSWRIARAERIRALLLHAIARTTSLPQSLDAPQL